MPVITSRDWAWPRHQQPLLSGLLCVQPTSTHLVAQSVVPWAAPNMLPSTAYVVGPGSKFVVSGTSSNQLERPAVVLCAVLCSAPFVQ